jgi:hypothetical protein
MNKQSVNSEQISAGGITVTTSNPIYVNTTMESPKDFYLNLDASSSTSEIAAFQSFAKSKGADLGKAGVDGKWGNYTAAAWNQYGNQYLASLNPTTSTTQPTTQTTKEPTEAQKKEAAKKGYVWDSINKKFATAKESGLLDTILGVFGVAKPQSETITQTETTSEDNKPKMSMGVKIAIGVGALAIVGGIIYAVTKKSK